MLLICYFLTANLLIFSKLLLVEIFEKRHEKASFLNIFDIFQSVQGFFSLCVISQRITRLFHDNKCWFLENYFCTNEVLVSYHQPTYIILLVFLVWSIQSNQEFYISGLIQNSRLSETLWILLILSLQILMDSRVTSFLKS